MSNLFETFSKNKNIKGVSVLSEAFKTPIVLMDTGVPALNLAYSGRLDGGTRFGLTTIAGRSRTFKTLLSLMTAKAYMDHFKDEDAFMVFYDSEGGAAQSYFEQIDIDASRVIRIPVMDIEELQFDITEKLEAIKEKYMATKKYTRVVFFTDSVGNLASRKEKEDALRRHGATDMGIRAKSLKSMYRVITPYFENFELHGIFINHVTSVPGAVPLPDVMTGGQAPMLSSNEVILITRRQIKNATTKVVEGWNFILNIEKSRDVKERMMIPFEVLYDGGLNQYTGLLDIALVTGHVIAPKQGWYTRPGIENDKNWRKKELMIPEFWDPILKDEGFKNDVANLYSLNGNSLLQEKLTEVIESDQAL